MLTSSPTLAPAPSSAHRRLVQDGVVFRLVWAAEAVRVQAMSAGHPRAEEVGDGPMLALTHGLPSIAAALLCQAGYASRPGGGPRTCRELERSPRDSR